MLTSSPDVETALYLISRVRGLCAAGGFNLTNEHVRKHVNLKQFEKSKNQSEKALGLMWNIDTDTFG